MTLGIFVVASRKDTAGDTYKEALSCYNDLADQVYINESPWPAEFSWKHIGNSFQQAYEKLDTDWVIHADLDFIFHEKDFKAIREACERHNESPALSFWKYQFILPDRYNLKSRLVVAVNKGKYGDRIRFDSGGDLCQPSLDGIYISPNSVPEAGVALYNYEKLLKTKEQVMDDAGRMERAYKRHFGKTQYGSDGTDEHAYKLWLKAQLGKFAKPHKIIPLSQHPKYIQQAIKHLDSDSFGYDGHGKLGRNIYA